MKHLKAYENNIEEYDISELKKFVVVNQHNSTKFKYVIYEIINIDIEKQLLKIKQTYSYDISSQKFKHHTQLPYITPYYLLKFNNIVLTSDSMKECRNYIRVSEDMNKFNL